MTIKHFESFMLTNIENKIPMELDNNIIINTAVGKNPKLLPIYK